MLRRRVCVRLAPRKSGATAKPPLPPLPAAYDWEKFRKDGKALIDHIADYHIALEKSTLAAGNEDSEPHFAVEPNVKPGFLRNDKAFNTALARSATARDAAQHTGDDELSFDEVLAEWKDKVEPGILHWSHPRFMGFFPCMLSPPALLGTLLADAYNQPGFTWDACPSATELEQVVMDALATGMQLPSSFKWSSSAVAGPSGGGGGVVQPSATEATIVCMLAAKQRALDRHAQTLFPGSNDDVSSRLVCYFSDQSHFMQRKAAEILGIPHIRVVKTYFDKEADNYPLDVDLLRVKIADDVAAGLVPFWVGGNFGATGTCAVDPLQDIAAVAKEANLWYHVDAAYAGAVALCPELRPRLGDLSGVDSISINGSKWMSLAFNCSFMFFKHGAFVTKALRATASYLPPTKSVDLKDYQLGLGRPFRSAKVYTTLRMMGATGIANVVRRHVTLAAYLADRLRGIPQLELLGTSEFALVVFRVQMMSDEDNDAFATRLRERLGAFLLATNAGNRRWIRISLSSAALDYADMDAIVAGIEAELQQ